MGGVGGGTDRRGWGMGHGVRGVYEAWRMKYGIQQRNNITRVDVERMWKECVRSIEPGAYMEQGAGNTKTKSYNKTEIT